jgi:hypothetical protein
MQVKVMNVSYIHLTKLLKHISSNQYKKLGDENSINTLV